MNLIVIARCPMLQKDDVVAAMPAHLRSAVSQGLVDKVNAISKDPEIADAIKGNFISYTSVLREGRFKTEDYLNAVAYVSYKLMGYNNEESYARTFNARYTALKAAGRTSKDISAYVSAYNKGKMVNLILEQTLIPAWVLNQDTYQNAINEQARLMLNAKSEKVRSDAANSILTHLKKPEKKEIDLNIGMQETSGMTELKDALTDLASRQQQAIQEGITTREIAHQSFSKMSVIDAEVVPTDEGEE
jgi:hypothetical protein